MVLINLSEDELLDLYQTVEHIASTQDPDEDDPILSVEEKLWDAMVRVHSED